MRRKNAYLVILGTHVDETLAIARIVRSRTTRTIAEAGLAQKQHRAEIQRTVLQWRTGRKASAKANAKARARKRTPAGCT